jgi:RNA polymerase sigma-70 factor (ECF subfamily)
MLPNLLVNSLYTTYEAQLRRYAEGLTHDYDQADDLVQEAFIRAADHADLLGQLDGPQRRSWLYTVVKNRFIDHLRTARRRQAILQSLAELVTRDEPSAEYAGEINLFERVPGRFKSLLIERYVQGLTSDEIALRLHVPAATVRSRIRLAINWLRTHPDEWN